MADSNYARSVFNLIKEASKAPKKGDFTIGAINYAVNYQTKIITGNFEFPLVESENTTTGGINLEVADFLQAPTPPTP